MKRPEFVPLTMSDLCGSGPLTEFGPVAKEELIAKSLANPGARGALSPTQINNVTKARIRQTVSNLIAEEMPQVKKALAEMAADNPKAYLETLMALMEFSLPKLKAMEIDVSDNRESTRQMTVQELQSAFSDTVVSTQ